jgi:tRNA G18 (ribose-2'-O)-methylase SpoU
MAVRANYCFSENTFCALTQQQKHKKCAEILKTIVLTKDSQHLKEEYTKLCGYLKEQPLKSFSLEAVEQRFHYHMQHSGKGIHEHQFLNTLSTQDGEPKKAWASIHTYLDGLRSAHNVGSIVRTIEAFRLGPIHLSADMMPLEH